MFYSIYICYVIYIVCIFGLWCFVLFFFQLKTLTFFNKHYSCSCQSCVKYYQIFEVGKFFWWKSDKNEST